MAEMNYVMIVIAAILINNVIFSRFLGICPYLGVSKKVSTAFGMGMAVVFVMTMATALTWPIQKLILEPYDMGYLQTISFILVIASLVQLVEIIMKKTVPTLYEAPRLVRVVFCAEQLDYILYHYLHCSLLC